AQPLPEAHPLHIQVTPGQSQFLPEGNRMALSQAQSAAKEIGEPDAHFASPGGIGRGERADGMETIEEKMRIDLGLERLQLGFARQDLGFARGLYRQQYIVEGDSQQVE